MADVGKNQTSPAASVPTLAEAPEPDIDSLLAQIPELKGVFEDSTEAPKQKEPASEVAAPEVEEEIQPGLDPALPLEEPEAEPEQIEEPEAEPEEPEKQDSVQKRIDKLTAARRTAEEKAEALATELNDLKAKLQAPPAVAPTPDNPLVNVTSHEELARRFDLSRQAKSWAFQHLDGGEVTLDDGTTKFLSGDQVKTILSRAEDMLTVHIPRQSDFLVKKQAWDAQAKIAYPTLSKAGHKDNQEYQAWLKAAPELQRFPDNQLIIGDAMLGRQIRLQREANAKKNGQTGANLPLSAPAPAAAPRVPKSRALSGAELTAIATDPQGGAFDKFVNQLIADAEATRPAQRAKR